jgi:hypothetical protein
MWVLRSQQLRFQRSNELNPRHKLADESFIVGGWPIQACFWLEWGSSTKTRQSPRTTM